MAGPSVAAAEIANACVADATAVLTDTYSDDSIWYNGVFEVVPTAQASHGPWGDKSSTIVFGSTPRERKDGESISYSRAVSGFTPQGAILLYGEGVAIPERAMEGNNGKANAVKLVTELTKQFSRGAIDQKNDRVARMLNKGAFTAGDVAAFRNSFEGNSATDGFVYDGKKLFADDHPLAIGGSTVIDNYLSAVALDAAGIDAAYIRMAQTNAIDETGARVTINPRMVLVPPQLRTTAHTYLKSPDQPDTTNRAINANMGLLDYKVVRNLSDTDGWFLVGAPEAIRIFDDGAPVLSNWWNPETRSWHFYLEYRHGAYVRDVRHILAANTSTS